jgi:hypothetical protein
VAAGVEPTANPDTGPCRPGSLQFHVNAQPVPGAGLDQIRVPPGGTLALAIDETATSGSLVLAKAHAGDPTTTDAGIIATFTASGIQPWAVQPIGWSASGDALLVSAGHSGTPGPGEGCNDLYLLQAEGSAVQLSSLTDDGWPGAVEGGTLSADGGRVAYFQQNGLRLQTELRLIDVHSPRPGIGWGDCGGPLGPARWSPDESRLLAICDNSFVVVDMTAYSRGTSSIASFSPALNTLVLTAGWTADSGSVVAVAARTDEMVSNTLEIAEIDAVTGARTDRPVSPTTAQWVVGSSSMSPDGRWALVQGNDSYAIDTATGTATNLPWIVLPNPLDPATVAWLAGGNSFLYANSGTLYNVDLSAMTRTEVGAIPTSDFAWHESKP